MTRLFKRGFEAHLFVWIFAVVAGTLILLFFIRLSFRHIDTENLLEDRTFIFDFEQQLRALSTSESVSKVLSFRQPVTLRFDCDFIIGKTYQRKTQDFLYSFQTSGSIFFLSGHIPGISFSHRFFFNTR